ncbi:helix-turn-helix domain-containing protein [Candidatus Regiella endosymbiont of Tuberolachnus salignus]|uniref:helix-turn-helix domain-containing protein n=1 Tax=Candidatus Regiella endosymbiont of Tuberolachnus salignus TaxID=3077956 RepID=UPI0030D5E817
MTDPIDTQSRHITPAGANIFITLGFSGEEAKALQATAQKEIKKTVALKKQLMTEIADWMIKTGHKQNEAAKILHVSRPRISDVVNQKTEKFTLDCLVGMIGNMGKSVRVIVE